MVYGWREVRRVVVTLQDIRKERVFRFYGYKKNTDYDI